jgi:hypothetical protein
MKSENIATTNEDVVLTSFTTTTISIQVTVSTHPTSTKIPMLPA